MIIDVEFQENTSEINAELQESESLIVDLIEKSNSGGTYQEGYEIGYSEGETAGKQAGYNSGYNDGNAAGIGAGKQAEHSKMWDRLQLNGEQTDYAAFSGFFHGKTFGFHNFYPKYDIRPVGTCTHLFAAWENKNGCTDHKGSLKQRLEECGVVLDTSKVTNISSMASYTNISEFPTLNFTGLTANSTSVFANSYSRIKTIEKIITKESVTYKNWFTNTDITNITFEGIIGKDIDFSYGSKITPASMKSVILHLKPCLNTEDEYLYTVNFLSASWDKLEADSTAPNGDTWGNYVVYVLGWNT